MGKKENCKPEIPENEQTDQEQGTRDYKKRSLDLIGQFFAVAEAVMVDAVALAQSGKDIRSNKKRPGLAALMHSANAAVGEIVRLAPMCGLLPTATGQQTATPEDITGTLFNLPAFDETHCNN